MTDLWNGRILIEGYYFEAQIRHYSRNNHFENMVNFAKEKELFVSGFYKITINSMNDFVKYVHPAEDRACYYTVDIDLKLLEEMKKKNVILQGSLIDNDDLVGSFFLLPYLPLELINDGSIPEATMYAVTIKNLRGFKTVN